MRFICFTKFSTSWYFLFVTNLGSAIGVILNGLPPSTREMFWDVSEML